MGGEALAWVAQRGSRSPGDIQGQAGPGSGQLDLPLDVPVHCRAAGLGDLLKVASNTDDSKISCYFFQAKYLGIWVYIGTLTDILSTARDQISHFKVLLGPLFNVM